MTIENKSNHLPYAGFLLLGGITLFWGLNWPVIKLILNEVPVWWFRSSCLIFSGLALLGVSAISGNRWHLRRDEIGNVVLIALFNVCCWQLLSAYSVSLMPAGRASILAYTMPLWAAIFSVWLLKETISLYTLTGLCLGLLGIGVLIGPDLVVFKLAPVGAICMLLAAAGWALGMVLFKRGHGNVPVASHIGWQLLIGAIPITIGAGILEPFPEIPSLSFEVWLALVYTYLFPMTFCQWAYLETVRMFTPSLAAIGTMLVPVIGVYSSYLFLAEEVGLVEFSALLMICSALGIVLILPEFARNPRH